jgi:hypothetical protein
MIKIMRDLTKTFLLQIKGSENRILFIGREFKKITDLMQYKESKQNGNS